MKETDDKLIRDFFGEHKKEITDNGFSRRVIRHLPGRQKTRARLWTALTTILVLSLFFLFDGLQAMVGVLRDAFVSMAQHGANNFDPRTLIIVLVVFACLGVRKAYSMI